MTTKVVNTTTTTTTTTLLRRTSRTSYRDNASDILPLRVCVTDDDWKDQMIGVAKALCPFLKPCTNMTVTPLSGGLSNELYIVRSADETKSVLVRIHPSSSASSNMPSIVDRHVENAISAWLSSQKVGPTYYGRFQNGRVEEFYPHHAPLSWKDMPRVGPSHIAPIMANFHALQVPSIVLQPTNPDGDIFARVREWMEIAVQLDGSRQPTNESRASQLLKQLQQDWTWLENLLLKQPLRGDNDDNLKPQEVAAMNFFSEIVFCHMDMQSLNLLRDTTQTDKDVIKVIDFEYAGFNPRGVDMANTFCEHCDMNNIRANYAKEYPSDDIQNAFIKRYMQQLLPATSKDLLQLADDPIFLEAARFVIGRYALVSHMSWAIWSIVQSHMSDIDFDYIHYAQHRRDGFEFMRQKLGL